MTPRFEYRLAGDRYAFFIDGEWSFTTDEVAFVFDLQDGIVLRHGEPDLVDTFYQRITRIATNHVAPHERTAVDHLVLIQGRYTIDDLNRLVQGHGHVQRFHSTLQADASQAWQTLLIRLRRSSPKKEPSP